jgi:putative transposase
LSTNDSLLDKLIVRERPGKMSFRFWQEGPGYDRNIASPDHLNDCINYIHGNPVRRGLCARANAVKGRIPA